MYDRAIEKLRDEMAENAGWDALTELGEMMCDYLRSHRAASEGIMSDRKTLKGAIGALEETARKNRKGRNCVCIPPEQAKKIVLDYYGISGAASTPVKRGGLDISLDDLLAEV